MRDSHSFGDVHQMGNNTKKQPVDEMRIVMTVAESSARSFIFSAISNGHHQRLQGYAVW